VYVFSWIAVWASVIFLKTLFAITLELQGGMSPSFYMISK
jgi:hypothetical protein